MKQIAAIVAAIALLAFAAESAKAQTPLITATSATDSTGYVNISLSVGTHYGHGMIPIRTVAANSGCTDINDYSIWEAVWTFRNHNPYYAGSADWGKIKNFMPHNGLEFAYIERPGATDLLGSEYHVEIIGTPRSAGVMMVEARGSCGSNNSGFTIAIRITITGSGGTLRPDSYSHSVDHLHYTEAEADARFAPRIHAHSEFALAANAATDHSHSAPPAPDLSLYVLRTVHDAAVNRLELAVSRFQCEDCRARSGIPLARASNMASARASAMP